MDISILIPTHARPTVIDQCLRCVAAQTVFARTDLQVEILIGLDGDEHTTPVPAVPDRIKPITTLRRFNFKAAVAVRSALHELATGNLIIWLNDDSYAQPDLIEAHLSVQQEFGPCFVAGAADFKPIEREDTPNLFDLVLHESDIMFFHEPSTQRAPAGYRDCYGLNMSLPRAIAQQVGGLAPLNNIYGYEDIELAYRVQAAGVPIIFAPDARVIHDHRYTPLDVHRREYLLGQSAWHYANHNPPFALDLFKRDLTDPQVLNYYEQALHNERPDAMRIEETFLRFANKPQRALLGDPDLKREMLVILAMHWIPLKRYLWRQGVLDASCGRSEGWSTLNRDTAAVDGKD